LVFGIFAVWYLFIKSWDYQLYFTKNTVRGKASGMMNYVIELNQFVKDNNLGLSGNPNDLKTNFVHSHSIKFG